MFKKLITVLLFTINLTYASDDPYETFDASKLMTNKTTITWRVVKNVLEECNKENKRWGYPPYTQTLLACSMQTKDTCLIITAKETTMWSVGHEIRHCFQGSWH